MTKVNPNNLINIYKKYLYELNNNERNSLFRVFKYHLVMSKISKYGLTDEIMNELLEMRSYLFGMKNKKYYYTQLALIYLHKNQNEDFEKILLKFEKNKDKKQIEYLKQMRILLSNDKVDQEKYLIKQINQVPKKNKYAYLQNVYDLAIYYYKMEQYDLAYICFDYIKKNANKTYLTSYSKELIDKIIDKKIEFKITDSKYDKLKNTLRNFDDVKKISNSFTKQITLTMVWIIVSFLLTIFLFKISYDPKVEFQNKFYRVKNTEECITRAYILHIKKGDILDQYNVSNDDDACYHYKYHVGYIEYEKGHNEIYKELVDNIALRHGLTVISNNNYNENEDETILEGVYNNTNYYSKIYRKGNTILYVVTDIKYKEDADNKLIDFGYTQKTTFKNWLKK